jgi:hypothetical protein
MGNSNTENLGNEAIMQKDAIKLGQKADCQK